MTAVPLTEFASMASPSSSDAVVPGSHAAPSAGRTGGGGEQRRMVRPFDLRRGDVLVETGEVVEGAGWPRKGRGGHVWFVRTSHGEMSWPLADHARFETVDVLREVPL